jgi:hypothetical protein
MIDPEALVEIRTDGDRTVHTHTVGTSRDARCSLLVLM